MKSETKIRQEWEHLKSLSTCVHISDIEENVNQVKRRSRELPGDKLQQNKQIFTFHRANTHDSINSATSTRSASSSISIASRFQKNETIERVIRADFENRESSNFSGYYGKYFKHHSLERTSTSEFDDYYTLKHTIKAMKRLSNLNLSFIYDDMSAIYPFFTRESHKIIIQNFGRLILNCQASTTFDLKYSKCKALLEESNRLEHQFYKRTHGRKLTGTEDPKSGGKKSLKRKNSDSNSNPGTPHEVGNGEGTPQGASPNFGNAWKTKYMDSLFLKTRYVFCSLGRFLGYDKAVNVMFHKYVDLVRTLTENPRFEAHEHSTPTDPAMRFYQDEIKSASSPYSAEKRDSYSSAAAESDQKSSVYAFLDEFLNVVSEQHPESSVRRAKELGIHILAKRRRWITHIRRLKIEEKRKEIESKIQLDMKQVRVNCKICGNKVAMEVIVEHSKNCREKMEQSRKLREINKLIHEDGFEALKLYRELHTKNVLAKREFEKLKKKLVAVLDVASMQSRNERQRVRSQSRTQQSDLDVPAGEDRTPINSSTPGSIIDLNPQQANGQGHSTSQTHEEIDRPSYSRKSKPELRKSRTVVMDDEPNDQAVLRDEEERKIHERVDEIFGSTNSKTNSPAPGLDELIQKVELSTQAKLLTQKSLPDTKSSNKPPTLKSRKYPVMVLNLEGHASVSFSDTGKQKGRASEDSDFLEDLKIPDHHNSPELKEKSPIRKRFIEEDGYNSCDEESVSPKNQRRLGDDEDELDDKDRFKPSTRRSRESKNFQLNIEHTSGKIGGNSRKSKFFVHRQTEKIHLNKQFEEKQSDSEKPENKVRSSKRNRTEVLGLKITASNTDPTPSEIELLKAIRPEEIARNKTMLKTEMILIKKKIAENCVRMDLYDLIKKLGKIICSHEIMTKKIELTYNETQKQIEELLKALPEGATDTLGENFNSHIMSKKEKLKEISEIQRKLDALEDSRPERKPIVQNLFRDSYGGDETPKNPFILLKSGSMPFHATLSYEKMQNNSGDELSDHLHLVESESDNMGKSPQNYGSPADALNYFPGEEGNSTPVQLNFGDSITFVHNFRKPKKSVDSPKLDPPKYFDADEIILGQGQGGTESAVTFQPKGTSSNEKLNNQTVVANPIPVFEFSVENHAEGDSQIDKGERTPKLPTYQNLSSPNTNSNEKKEEPKQKSTPQCRIQQDSPLKLVKGETLTTNPFINENSESLPSVMPSRKSETRDSKPTDMTLNENFSPSKKEYTRALASVTGEPEEFGRLKRYQDYGQDLEIPAVDSSLNDSGSKDSSERDDETIESSTIGRPKNLSLFGQQNRRNRKSTTLGPGQLNLKVGSKFSQNSEKNNDITSKATPKANGQDENNGNDGLTIKQISSNKLQTIVERNHEEQHDDIDVPAPDMASVAKGYYSDSHVRYSSHTETIEKNEDFIGIDSFEFIKFISKGAFGRVWLVRRKATNDLYAMKIIDIGEKNLESLKNEKKIFDMLRGDFVVKAVFTFTHESFICFIMEFMVGGDFGDVLYEYGRLDDWVAKFYVAEIVLAVEYLHSVGIVHRDLKPDNFLLDAKGHIKLTDFGLSDSGIQQKVVEAKNTEQLHKQKDLQHAFNKLLTPIAEKTDVERSYKINNKFGSIYSPAPVQKSETVAGDLFAVRKTDSSGSAKRFNTDEMFSPIMVGKSLNDPRSNSKEPIKFSFDSTANPMHRASLPQFLHQRSMSPAESPDKSGARKDVKKTLITANRLIGTPDYMAPEIIKGVTIKHPSIDWWSVGVIMFELLTGFPPFNADTVEKIYDNILNLRIPWDSIEIGDGEDQITEDAADLIKQLLTLDHTKRLTAAEIKKHPWFNGIDWGNLRKLEAPIIPEHTTETDTHNFKRMQNQEEHHQNPFMLSNVDPASKEELKRVMKTLRSGDDSQFTMNRYDILDRANQDLFEGFQQEKKKKAEAELKQLQEKEGIIVQEIVDLNSSFELELKYSQGRTNSDQCYESPEGELESPKSKHSYFQA